MRLGILAGQGALPQMIAGAHPEAAFMHFDGVAVALPENDCLAASFEKFGALFDALRDAGVTEVVFAGGLARPALNPANFDAKMMQLAPGFMAAMKGGDDGLLRAVIAAFEAEGFKVRGAHELIDGLTASPGLLAGPEPSEIDRADMARARAILEDGEAATDALRRATEAYPTSADAWWAWVQDAAGRGARDDVLAGCLALGPLLDADDPRGPVVDGLLRDARGG